MHTRSNAQISETASVSRDFSDFFERHFEDVARALAICLGDTQMAADCAQEAMVRAYQRFDEVRMFENPAGWLFRVGLNLGRSRFRRLRSELLGLARDEPVSDPDPLPPSVVQRTESPTA